jgi:hypothetical protein
MDSVLHGNVASSFGGGIYNEGVGVTTLTNSILSNNSANSGGGIDNAGTSILANITLNNNSAVHGGGVFSDVTLTLTDSTLNNNTASIDGGGIFINSGTAQLANATLSGNAAQSGGGLINFGNSRLTNVTLDNQTTLTGTAYNLYLGGGVITLTNTLLNFVASSGANCFGAGAPKSFSGGHNAANDTSCGLLGTGDQQGPLVPLLLGPLANHGGPTLTQLPRHGSIAIDNGDNAACAAAPINNLDQRGVLRPYDGDGDGLAICDIGAVERRPSDSDLVPWLYLPLILR